MCIRDMYQHDMNQKRLEEALNGVVEDCVNKVGVDLNKMCIRDRFNDEFMEEDVDNHETVTITKSKKFAIKPMDVEEACVQMELLGHNFFVFRNAETFEVNVVYKRKDKTYGLIEPEF